MVTDTAGLGDQNFNDLAKRGLDQAAADFGIQGNVIESRDAAAYIPNLTQAAEQGDLTVGVGFLLTEAITEVANQYPDDTFS
jgi:basic membrane protein A